MALCCAVTVLAENNWHMKKLKLIYLNTTFYLLFFLASALIIPTLSVILVTARIFISERLFYRYFRRAIRFYGQVVVRLPYPLVKVRYEDMSNVDKSVPHIYVCNHNSMSDPFLMSVFPYEMVQVVNVWPFSIPIIGYYARLGKYLDVNNMPFEKFLADAKTLLDEGVSIAFFPEGTRIDGAEMGSFHSGAFRLFLETKAPIVPVCIYGNKKIPPKGSMWLHPGTIIVRSLPPVTWEEYQDSTAYVVKSNVRKRIGEEIATMSEGQ